jgi:aspartyl protease family protein
MPSAPRSWPPCRPDWPRLRPVALAWREAAVRQPRFWILLTGLLVAILVLAAQYDTPSIMGISPDDFASLTWKVVLIVFLAGGVFAMFRGRLAQALRAALLWVAIVLLLAVGYAYRFDLRDVGERVLAELIPGYARSKANVVELARGSAGGFPVRAQINGARIPMVLDTGASAVVLTQEAAKAAGLPLEVLTYNVNVDTANGRTRAALVTLDKLAIGGIVERSVPALIAQPGQLRVSLLGMSFLNRLEGWEVRGEKLVLRGYP